MVLHLRVLHAFDKTLDTTFFLQDVKAHLKDVVHLEFIAEALLLKIRIDVAQSLAA